MVTVRQSMSNAVKPFSLREVFAWARTNGWPCFPIIHDEEGKRPLVKGGVGAATLDPAKHAEWERSFHGLATGVAGACTGRFVLDLDGADAVAQVKDFPETLVFASGSGSGRHLVYTLPDGVDTLKNRVKAAELGDEVDVRTGPRAYIVLPGSTHLSGGRYRVLGGTEAEAPADLLERSQRGQDGAPIKRSTLSELLASPPTEGGRNDWLTKVAGHLAKNWRDKRDVYDTYVQEAAGRLAQPLEQDEIAKVADSLWSAEHGAGKDSTPLRERFSRAGGSMITAESGRELLAMATINKSDMPVPVTNFGAKALTVFEHPTTEDESILIAFATEDGRDFQATVPMSLFADSRQLNAWLAARALWFVTSDVKNVAALPIRFLQFLMAQGPQRVVLQTAVGWLEDEHGFLLGESVIDASGERPARVGALPERTVAQSRMYSQFGMEGTEAQAFRLLRRCSLYQDHEVAMIYGAWWAAHLIRHRLARMGSFHFPIMAIEAGSGAGKTTGFFGIMAQLGGSVGGGSTKTAAVLRNQLSHSNLGILWLDDMHHFTPAHLELMRGLTTGGTVNKMAAGNAVVEEAPLRGSLMISGESLGLSHDTALLERTIQLRPPRVQGRKNRAGGSQWDDIQEDMAELAQVGDKLGGAALAGHFLAWVARHDEDICALIDAMESTDGNRRAGVEKVMCAGAVVYEAMVSGESIEKVARNSEAVRIVRASFAESEFLDLDLFDKAADGDLEAQEAIDKVDMHTRAFPGDNVLTTKILPAYMRSVGPKLRVGRKITSDTVAMVQQDSRELSFNLGKLAAWWRETNPGADLSRESFGFLNTMITSGRQAGHIMPAGHVRTSSAKFVTLPRPMSEVVLERARS